MINENRILVIENEVELCLDCQRIFEQEGFMTEIAHTGEEAISKVHNQNFDAILADLKISDIDGIEIFNKLKKEDPDVPVIMITGFSSVSSAVDVMKLGATDYIPKPYKPEEIIKAVKEAIKKRTEKKMKKQIVINSEEVIAVLNKTSVDENFCAELLEKGSKALDDYDLKNETKNAIVSGNINWIEKRVGKLTEAQKKYLICRLQMERW